MKETGFVSDSGRNQVPEFVVVAGADAGAFVSVEAAAGGVAVVVSVAAGAGVVAALVSAIGAVAGLVAGALADGVLVSVLAVDDMSELLLQPVKRAGRATVARQKGRIEKDFIGVGGGGLLKPASAGEGQHGSKSPARKSFVGKAILSALDK